ncbi:MAG: hypothetical protein LUD69_00175 [Oscillospiraceae bacterium]|nr:hypothetical protein [Oscillospiraceae bacterium]
MAHGSKTDTARNIQLYRAALPRMRGKVMSVLGMLVISAVLLAGTTYAWVTLSTAPEVTGVTTSLSANGALEIALSDADGEEPDASAVGDSSANQEVTAANLTWGNLVDLSDSSYGLDNLTIYPSRLNTSSLRTSPLMAVNYGADGRVTTLNTILRYTIWSSDYSLWQLSSNYGVRAVATVETSSTAQADLATLTAAAQTQLALAEDAYAAVLSSNSGYMASLAAMIGDYMDYRINGGTAPDFAGYTEDIYNMYVDLSAAAERLGEAYAAIAEIYQYDLSGGMTEGVKNYTPYTLSDLLAKNEAEWEKEGITLTGWDEYLALRATLEENTELALALHNQGLAGSAVSWSAVKPVLEDLFPYDDENTTYTYKSTYGNRVYHWGDFYGDNATVVIMYFLCADVDPEETLEKNIAYVTLGSGLLYDFEELISYSATTDRLEAHFTYSMFPGWDLWIQMVVSTASANDYASDAIAAAPTDSDVGSASTAAETYGMAVDLWVRTNAEGSSYLLLDGALVKDDDGSVSGYEGSNRIWTDYDDDMIYGTATTQGSGSGYVFYYSSAEELTNDLNLIDAMTVVFFNTQTGTKLATASFDTSNYYENSGGQVTVPLVVDSTESNQITVTEDGETTSTYYITQLTQNEALPITALLYLDGTQVSNTDSSAAEDFTGQLNIQFASSATLTTAGSTTGELYTDAVGVSASAEYTVDGETEETTATVTLTVTSSETPTSVSTGYSRQINNGAQALKPDTVDCTLSESAEGESVWTMAYTFSTAGTYVLANVTVDGKEYELEEPLTFEVEGFTPDAVYWDYGSSTYTVLTADSSLTVPVTLKFGAAYTGGESVRAAFVSSSGAYVYAALTSDDDGLTWSGSAAITASGTYTLKYFYIGSDVYDIPESMQKTLTTSMGLRAAVRLTCENFEEGQTSILFEDGKTYTVNTYVTLTNNSGSVLRNVAGSGGLAEGSTIKLRYSKSGSTTEYLETELKWDSSSSSYVGAFSVSETGVYSFSAVTIGSESVTSSTSAPSLSVHYDEGNPPTYAENLTSATQTVIGGNGSFVVKMANSSSAWTIKAVVKDTDITTDDVTYTLDGTKGAVDSTGTARWTFAAVDDSGDALEGNFQMTELQIYSASTGDLYMTLDVFEEGITAKIVTTVYISTSYDGEEVTDSITLTSGYAATSLASVTDETEESGNFYAVAALDLSALDVSLTDFEGKAVSGVAATSLEYTLDTTSTEDYGYTIVYNETDAPVAQTLAVTTASDGSCTFEEEEIGFNLWGEYTAVLTYTVDGKVCTAELAPVEYSTGTLPTFGNASGTLPNTGLSTKQSNRSGVTNTLVTASDEEEVYDFFSYASDSSSLETGQDTDGDGDASDFIWNAYYLAAILPQYSKKENTTQKVMWDFDGWQKPSGYVQMYAQNIYLSDEDAPAVWVTAEDGVVADDGTIANGNILLGSTLSEYMTRNFAYTEAISSSGLVSQSTLNGKTIQGMGVGRVTGDEDSTSRWYNGTISNSTLGADRIILGTYETTTKPVYALGSYGGYVTGELDTSYTVWRCVTEDMITENTLYQTVMTDYQPLDIEEIYVQYNGVTYKVSTSNVLEINMFYDGIDYGEGE